MSEGICDLPGFCDFGGRCLLASDSNLSYGWRFTFHQQASHRTPTRVLELAEHGTPCCKVYEDGLDAVVCAWVGSEYVEARAEPFGDAKAAIWVPT